MALENKSVVRNVVVSVHLVHLQLRHDEGAFRRRSESPQPLWGIVKGFRH